MISNKMAQILNEQIKKEFDSSYIYLAMSAYCKGENLKGSAKWFAKQAQEEWGHGMKIFDYLYEQDRNVILQSLDKPQSSYASVLVAFEETLKHEKQVTASIHSIMDLAIEEKDYATKILMDWFVNEQVEEEATAKEIVDKLKLVKDNISALFFIDQQLGSR